MSTNKNGFTLIELLVVISIIGLLASVVLVSLNSARLKARNAKRVADIRQLQTAFNLALNDLGTLPAGADNCISASCYGFWSGQVASAAVDSALAPYISRKPDDPSGGSRGGGGYLYNSTWTGGAMYDGSIWKNVGYIAWVMELPYSSGICGSGSTYSVTSTYIECLATQY